MARPRTDGVHPASSIVVRGKNAGVDKQRPMSTDTSNLTRNSSRAMGGKNSHGGKDAKTVKTGSNIKRRGR